LLGRALPRLVSGLLSATVLVMVGAKLGSPQLRATTTLAFFLLAPGAALLEVVRPDRTHEAIEWLVAIGVSVTLCILVSEAQVLLGVWQPRPTTLALAALTLACALAPRAVFRKPTTPVESPEP
jgi:uncharacterized membrane protein